MKKFDTPPRVKLVCGVLFKDIEWLNRGLIDLQEKYGNSDFQSAAIEFTFTDYYYKEMGQPLFRVFISFSPLIDSADLGKVKVFTNSVEEKYAEQAQLPRVLNIDPGYINAAAYILATSKNFAHRIYLGNGVFAQQELLFGKRRVQTLDWTYPDYRSYEYQEMLGKIREAYLRQLK
jgi:Domain of unknown function (DUF4416)